MYVPYLYVPYLYSPGMSFCSRPPRTWWSAGSCILPWWTF